jgi:hypothetical protein
MNVTEGPAGAGCCEAREISRLLMLDFFGSGIWTGNDQRSLCSAVLTSSVSGQRGRLLESVVLSCVLKPA